MTSLQRYFVKFFCFLVFFTNCVHCSYSEFKSYLFDIKQISYELFLKNDFNISNIIIETISKHDWAENHECLLELNAIKNGIDNFEEWAFESM